MPEFEAVSKETLGTTVYNRIRQAILNGDFRPGDKVKIREIAGQMAVSGTPVRDALLQLVMERALEMPSPREIRVPHLSGAELAEIRLLRVTLEGMAAEAAAARATPQDIARLEELNDTILTAFAEGDAHLALSHNRAFHSHLYRLSGMEVAAEILDRLWLRMAPLIASWASYAEADDFVRHHYPVIDALKRGDGPAARQAIADDIVASGIKIDDIRD
ncbi:GntR family transcriptional regulator [Roseovarius nubinhibens]|uniref:Putative GntR-family transcriptional regulator n=1 Tax=Roseovarius nubinhibens (strain ATCC BAA-591 / DSM 15170 / ISM) TaxID=89187 RepID=A3SIW0_ROSNI|nr:GntR family transcriptional regulator [Roseovarius nubinhibens]EAP77291.1 putative GntR-family transcriptional regulator [Roseovarius nubinhibens ISM]